MTGTIRHARLESRKARSRLKRGRQAHWQAIVPGRVHIGYQRWPDDPDGRWLLRRWLGRAKTFTKYATIELGRADDAQDANGSSCLSFEQATAKARAMVDAPAATNARGTVADAFTRYVEYKRSLGQGVDDLLSRGRAHILPQLGDKVVSELTAEQLRRWLATLAATPAQTRPKDGRPQFRAEPTDDEAIRRRRASANRVLTYLKATLNHSFDEGHVANRDAWGRKLKPFRDVDVARVRYLTIEEAQRLINAADAEFRQLLIAALQTGCRYSELARLQVADFNPDAGTLAIRKSKSGKARHVILTAEGSEFFRSLCVGRAGGELMLRRADGSAWGKSEQGRPMAEANARARISPPVSFHILRHTWASHSVMAGVPLLVVAKNLGHSDTRMVEKHYGHLAPSYIADAIRAGAPQFGLPSTSNVRPMSRRR
jgi:integrase